MRSVHSGQIERWLGPEQAERISRQMRGWYGPPIVLTGVPGHVVVGGDGDFSGQLKGGFFASMFDYARDMFRRAGKVQHGTLNGFAGMAALQTALRTRRQFINFNKNDGLTVQFAKYDFFMSGPNPPAGAAAAAAPGGTVLTRTSTGAMPIQPPISGETLHFYGYDSFGSDSDRSNVYILYDRLFAVAKTMNSTAAEAVTGVPTRYQDSSGDGSSAGNFLFCFASSTLAATAHNWTTCLYTDQSGNTGATLPSVTGVSACATRRLDFSSTDLPVWWFPLASGDTGIRALEQMQCSAAVATGTVEFVIGHPIAILQTINLATPNIEGFPGFVSTGFNFGANLPRIFDDACLALLGVDGNSATENHRGAFSIVSG